MAKTTTSTCEPRFNRLPTSIGEANAQLLHQLRRRRRERSEEELIEARGPLALVRKFASGSPQRFKLRAKEILGRHREKAALVAAGHEGLGESAQHVLGDLARSRPLDSAEETG